MGKGIKTHKATAKRFKKTASGKLVHKRQYDNDHLKANKSNRTKNRQGKRSQLGSRTQIKALKKLITNK
ncbi:50S ribosomal protein L35 [Candidatus Dojkabacteria bacterium]|nr:50S ribosomal protein L35 [Candidatus Dojkabacteria bacterium]